MKFLKYVFSALFFFFALSAYSQFSKGMLKMEVSGIKMNGEDAPPEMASHLGNMDVSIYSDGVIQKSVMSMMMMKTTTLMDTQSDSIQIYMDMMGKKYKISESRKSSMDDSKESVKNMKETMDIKEFPEDVKEILGYKCHRVEIKMNIGGGSNTTTEESQEVNMKLYVTKDIRFDPSFITQTSKKIALNGTPMEYTMTMGGGSFQMELTMLAKEYKMEVNPSDLLPPSGTYKNYTMEEFQKEMNAMGGR